MPNSLVIYMVAHQPRRIKLPALLIPRGTPPEKMDALIFDDQMDRRYFDKVIILIVLTSLLPTLIEIVKARRQHSKRATVKSGLK